MSLSMRNMALLAKLETVYGTDSVPTGGANAMLVRNVQHTPLATVQETRDLVRPYFGNSPDVLGAYYAQVRFDVEAAGAGTPGGIPAYDPLLRACAFARVNTPGVSTQYNPVTSGLESVTLYYFLDGVLHRMLGARGNVSFRGNNRSACMFGFEFTGLFVPVIDQVPPASVYSGFVAPLAFNTANTPTFQIHGVNGAVLRTFTFDMGNQVVYRNLVNDESVRINDRKPTGTLEMGAVLMATKNWFQTVLESVQGTLTLQHGPAVGNRLYINAPALQLSQISYSDYEGDAMLACNTKFNPVNGNDELTIFVS